MNTHRSLNKLIQLNALADEVLEFRYREEDESHLGRNTAIGAGALTAGAYARGRYLQPNQPGGLLSAAEAQPGFKGAARRHLGTLRAGATQAVMGDTGLGQGIDKYRSMRAGADAGLGMGRGASLKAAVRAMLSKFRR